MWRLSGARRTLPVAVGFGIKDADSARAVAAVADAVVVGSALIDAMVRVAEHEPAAIRRTVCMPPPQRY